MSYQASASRGSTHPGSPIARLRDGIFRFINAFRIAPKRGSDASAKAATRAQERDVVAEASEDSFPASDPPAWTAAGTKDG